MLKTCPICNGVLPHQNHKQMKYCSVACRQRAADKNRTQNVPNEFLNLPTLEKGFICENLVVNDLFLKGYAVFKSFTNCAPYDLVIVPRGAPDLAHAKTVEVKCGAIMPGGRISATVSNTNKFDHLAVVLANENYRILYLPDIPSITRIK